MKSNLAAPYRPCSSLSTSMASMLPLMAFMEHELEILDGGTHKSVVVYFNSRTDNLFVSWPSSFAMQALFPCSSLSAIHHVQAFDRLGVSRSDWRPS
eukprot:scaffold41178_cov22-Tisochrysis_lutea.AAC.1